MHYLPHRAVIKIDKNTTKLRIVMDASARPPSQKDAPSLNDCLHTGPLLLKQLAGILLRFRFMKRVILADIEKAFLQLGVRETDRDCTRFLWVENPEQINLENFQYAQCLVFRFCRVSFGLTVSPFLLNATIREHLSLFDTKVERTIEENLYVDNIMIEVEPEEDVNALCFQAIDIFKSGGMKLREFFGLTRKESRGMSEDLLIRNQIETKILGIRWNLKEEYLIFKMPTFEGQITKRNILAAISKIYDPIGLISPVLIQAKLLLQKIFEANYKWDAPIEQSFCLEWNKIMLTWKESPEIKIPRFLGNKQINSQEFHCFTDASKYGFGAAIYVKTSEEGSHPGLIFSKSLIKPASLPSNATTIPKLELQALTLGAKMIKFLQNELNFNMAQATIWSDSQCNIERLRRPGKYDRFVTNRLIKIRNLCSVKHTTTTDNPADICSRGATPLELMENQIWLHGPKWLKLPRREWPKSLVEYFPGQEVQEKTAEFFLEGAVTEDVPKRECIIDITRFSKYKKLLGALSIAFKFIKLLQHKTELSIITSGDIKIAETYLIKSIQEQYAPSEEAKINLQMFSDQGIWKCHGRIDESDLKNQTKSPIFLPDSWLTKLIILDIHYNNKHCGTETTLCILRQKFWIIRGRKTIHSIIYSNKYGCLLCRKFKIKPFPLQKFDQLPKYRVTMARPFCYCGIDYFGPINVKGQNVVKKVYGALFTCLTIRAIHIELVEDVSTKSFIQAYRRFVARRGTPSIIASDNATNFTMGSKIIKELNKELIFSQEVQEMIKYQGTEWKFITPRNPREGGAWERMIGITKTAMKRSIGKSLLTDTELSTLFCELEAIVNSRPLTYQSDREPGRVIRPVDFLIPYDNAEIIFPQQSSEKDEDYVPPNLENKEINKELKFIQLHLNKFWNIWHNSYLTSLRERVNKSSNETLVPQIGEIVIVEQSEAPRSVWKLGKIIELIKGRDNIIRTAKIQINKKIFLRSINLIFPLELKATMDNSKQLMAATVVSSKPSNIKTTPVKSNKWRRIQEEKSPSADSSDTEVEVLEVQKRPLTQNRPIFMDKAHTANKVSVINATNPPISLNTTSGFDEEAITDEEELDYDEWPTEINPYNSLPRGYKIPRIELKKPKRLQTAGLNMLIKSLGGTKYCHKELIRLRHKQQNNLEIKRKLEEIKRKDNLYKIQLKKQGANVEPSKRLPNWHKERAENVMLTTELDLTTPNRENERKMKAAKHAASLARRKLGIKGSPEKFNEEAPRELQINQCTDIEVFEYSIFTNCTGVLHERCRISNNVSSMAQSRPNIQNLSFPVVQCLMEMLIFDWISRQHTNIKYRQMASALIFTHHKEGIFSFLRSFWYLIKKKAVKAFNDKAIMNVLEERLANCHLLYSIWAKDSYGPIRLKGPPLTENQELNQWLNFITDMVNKGLTKRRYNFFQGRRLSFDQPLFKSNIVLIDAETILVSEWAIQDVLFWTNDSKNTRLVTIDGSKNLQNIFFIGRNVRNLVIIVKADEELAKCIDSSLNFFKESNIKLKTTIILIEPVRYTERLLMTRQMFNIARTYQTNFFICPGKPGDLKRTKEKMINQSIEEEEEIPENKISTASFLTSQLPLFKNKNKTIDDSIAINEEQLSEKSSSPPIHKGGRTSMLNYKYGFMIILLLFLFISMSVALPIINPLLIPILKRGEVNQTPTFPFTTKPKLMLLKKKPPRIIVTVSPALLSKMKKIKYNKTEITPTSANTTEQIKTTILPSTEQIIESKPQKLISNTTSQPEKIKLKTLNTGTTPRYWPEVDQFDVPIPIWKRGLNDNKRMPCFWCAHTSSSIWNFPDKDDSPYCTASRTRRKWKPFKVSLYSHISQSRELSAHRCSIKKVEESYYTNLLGDRFLNMEKLMVVVSKEECIRMKEDKICTLTKKILDKIDRNSWATNEPIIADFPGRFASLFGGEKKAIATNCLFQNTSLFYKQQTLELISHLYNLQHCKFEDEYCLLKDNTSIIWNSNCTQHNCNKCFHQFAQKLDGSFKIDETRLYWISQSKEQALTFSLDSTLKEKSCKGDKIILSEQGFGIKRDEFQTMLNQKSKRNVEEDQLASELTAAEMDMNQVIEQLLKIKCQQIVRNSNPTIQARKIFGKGNLVATWIGENTMQIYNCAEIEMNSITPRATSTCYKYLPVNIELYKRKMEAFLDLELRVLSVTSPPADCGRFQYPVLEIEKGKW
nr:unnamed protein product [Meloidogyne enterolobii]